MAFSILKTYIIITFKSKKFQFLWKIKTMKNLYITVTKIFLTVTNKRENHHKLDLEEDYFKSYLLYLFIHEINVII